MAIAYVESMPVVIYHGITIYHIYKDDLIDQTPREFWFALNPYGAEGSEDAFDIRDMAGFDRTKTPAANLVHMIDAGLFGETNLIEREALHTDDTYAAEETQTGKCPVCGVELTEYGSFEVQDHQVEYSFTCINCGVSGSEWGDIVFDGFTVP